MLAEKGFEAFALNGHNYTTWNMTIKITLAFHGIMRAIQAPRDSPPTGATPLTEE
jgi:hypothetical protein